MGTHYPGFHLLVLLPFQFFTYPVLVFRIEQGSVEKPRLVEERQDSGVGAVDFHRDRNVVIIQVKYNFCTLRHGKEVPDVLSAEGVLGRQVDD